VCSRFAPQPLGVRGLVYLNRSRSRGVRGAVYSNHCGPEGGRGRCGICTYATRRASIAFSSCRNMATTSGR